MPGVFVSYSRPSAQTAEQVAAALSSLGYEVWWDDRLPAHRAYGDVIEENLRTADAVIVLWSSDACRSQWVRAEADWARQAGTLVQASLDSTIPPLPFNQIQCADLTGWDGHSDSPGWQKLQSSVASLVGEQQTGDAPKQSPKARRNLSICVLPFANMSGDAEQEYFSDGISEDITTDLSKISALAVTARNTAFMFKGESVDVEDVASKLAVSHILEGSVRKAGGRVRITAQLIDGLTGDHIWAERYDRDLTDIFAIQDEISKAIVDALRLKLLPEEKKAIEQRGTTNVDAYNYYLLARKYWITGNWGNTDQLELVIRICRRSLELDPNYARVWGLMALVQCILFFTFAKGDDDGTAAADRALALDPHIAEAYCVRARHSYEQGRFEEADETFRHALELDPESWEVNREVARVFYFERRFTEAARHYENALAIDDSDYHSWNMLVSVYEALGDKPASMRAAEMAISAAEGALAQDPTNGSALSTGVCGLAILGHWERAKEWIDRALLVSPDNIFMRYNFACTLAMHMQDAEGALDLLDPIFPGFTASAYKAISADPDLDKIRDHPRFKQLMEVARTRLAEELATPAAT